MRRNYTSPICRRWAVACTLLVLSMFALIGLTRMAKLVQPNGESSGLLSMLRRLFLPVRRTALGAFVFPLLVGGYMAATMYIIAPLCHDAHPGLSAVSGKRPRRKESARSWWWLWTTLIVFTLAVAFPIALIPDVWSAQSHRSSHWKGALALGWAAHSALFVVTPFVLVMALDTAGNGFPVVAAVLCASPLLFVPTVCTAKAVLRLFSAWEFPLTLRWAMASQLYGGLTLWAYTGFFLHLSGPWLPNNCVRIWLLNYAVFLAAVCLHSLRGVYLPRKLNPLAYILACFLLGPGLPLASHAVCSREPLELSARRSSARSAASGADAVGSNAVASTLEPAAAEVRLAATAEEAV